MSIASLSKRRKTQKDKDPSGDGGSSPLAHSVLHVKSGIEVKVSKVVVGIYPDFVGLLEKEGISERELLLGTAKIEMAEGNLRVLIPVE